MMGDTGDAVSPEKKSPRVDHHKSKVHFGRESDSHKLHPVFMALYSRKTGPLG